jgi:hypothetical protein
MAYHGDMSPEGIEFFANCGIEFPQDTGSKLVSAIGKAVDAYNSTELTAEQKTERKNAKSTMGKLRSELGKLSDPAHMGQMLGQLVTETEPDKLNDAIALRIRVRDKRIAHIPALIAEQQSTFTALGLVKAQAGVKTFVREMGGRVGGSTGTQTTSADAPTEELMPVGTPFTEGQVARTKMYGHFWYVAYPSKVTWELWRLNPDTGKLIKVNDSSQHTFALSSFSGVNKLVKGTYKDSHGYAKLNAGGDQGVRALQANAKDWLAAVQQNGDIGTADAPENVVTLCKGTTKANKPCRKRAVAGSDFCSVHKPKEETTE